MLTPTFQSFAFVMLEGARLLGLGLGCDPFPGGSNSSSDEAHEEWAVSRGTMCMLFGTCDTGALDFKREIMSVSDN